MAMLSVDIRALEKQAVHIDGRLSPDDPVWEPGDPVPEGAIRVTGRLSQAGPGRFYFHGRMEGQIDLECRRCLAEVPSSAVDQEVQVLFAEGDAETAEDPDVYQIEPRSRELDVRPALREQWLLAVPMFALCRDECAGLCPRCGADLNEGPCDCPPAEDHRWAALRELRNAPSDNS